MKIVRLGDRTVAQLFTRDHVRDLVDNGPDVDGVTVEGEALRGPDGVSQDLTWLNDVPLRHLTLAGDRLPVIPDTLLEGLEWLHLHGRVRRPISTSTIPRMRDLSIPVSGLDGSLSSCNELNRLELRGWGEGTGAPFSGCRALTSLKVVGRGQHSSIAFSWPEAPARLRDILLVNVHVTSFDGLGELPDLERLLASASTPPADSEPLSVRNLAQCRRLRFADLQTASAVSDLEALVALPELERVIVRAGQFSPPDVPELPLVLT